MQCQGSEAVKLKNNMQRVLVLIMFVQTFHFMLIGRIVA